MASKNPTRRLDVGSPAGLAITFEYTLKNFFSRTQLIWFSRLINEISQNITIDFILGGNNNSENVVVINEPGKIESIMLNFFEQNPHLVAVLKAVRSNILMSYKHNPGTREYGSLIGYLLKQGFEIKDQKDVKSVGSKIESIQDGGILIRYYNLELIPSDWILDLLREYKSLKRSFSNQSFPMRITTSSNKSLLYMTNTKNEDGGYIINDIAKMRLYSIADMLSSSIVTLLNELEQPELRPKIRIEILNPGEVIGKRSLCISYKNPSLKLERKTGILSDSKPHWIISVIWDSKKYITENKCFKPEFTMNLRSLISLFICAGTLHDGANGTSSSSELLPKVTPLSVMVNSMGREWEKSNMSIIVNGDKMVFQTKKEAMLKMRLNKEMKVVRREHSWNQLDAAANIKWPFVVSLRGLPIDGTYFDYRENLDSGINSIDGYGVESESISMYMDVDGVQRGFFNNSVYSGIYLKLFTDENALYFLEFNAAVKKDQRARDLYTLASDVLTLLC
jgi:hypothetical protein